jgi:hypothetical protein
MGIFKQIYSSVKNIERSLFGGKKTLTGLEVELHGGTKTTIKGWNFNGESKIVLSLTNGLVLLLENLPLTTLEKIEDGLY